ncbi:hypothetical protein DFH08DRAFT_974829 [Mycena albidolilacea]|uniref:Uncharacterized protein n=1 Tax=Mycena albidolilacea TaxID=1033008 RepID=A0AAD6Z5Z1_9AGAR|nr:hypothetical protein DFH08DRAFT_974829 [Mycena albidolilacea]
MPGQGEELAFVVGFDDNREMMIEKIYQPRGGLMTAEKIIEAYVAASEDAKDMKEDDAATDLFSGYRAQNIEEVDGVPHKVFANVLEESAKQYKGLRDSGQEKRTWHTVNRMKKGR